MLPEGRHYVGYSDPSSHDEGWHKGYHVGYVSAVRTMQPAIEAAWAAARRPQFTDGVRWDGPV